MRADDPIIGWLLDGDPAIRWQVQRDLLDAPAAIWEAERARVEHVGWGARLLSLADPDGQWAGGAFAPADFDFSRWDELGQPWTATTYALTQLREFGLDPTSAQARKRVRAIGASCRWEEGGQPFWSGEVEECINGRTVADGSYFGVDMTSVVRRLLMEQQPDGGWNCERASGSRRSSFHTTINVLEGLDEYRRRGGVDAEVGTAITAGEEFLLQRRLYRRLRSGEVADPRFLQPIYPTRWRYDVLRGLHYFAQAGRDRKTVPAPQLTEAIDVLIQARLGDGRWAPGWTLRGQTWFDLDDGIGRPSRWLTLRALRVLRWWSR